jgi:hypothetical protein
MTTADLVTYCRQLWGQTASNAGGVTDLDIVAYLNDRQTELCADSDISASAWTASTVAGQQQYSVPPEYSSVEAIQLYQATGLQAQYWLEKTDITDMDPRLAPGMPTKFALWGLNVSGSNARAFWLDPIPTALTVVANDLRCYGRQVPLTLVSGAQGPEVELRWQYAICRGALSSTFQRLASSKREYFALADRAEAKWQADKGEAKLQKLIDMYKPGRPKNTMRY